MCSFTHGGGISDDRRSQTGRTTSFTRCVHLQYTQTYSITGMIYCIINCDDDTTVSRR